MAKQKTEEELAAEATKKVTVKVLVASLSEAGNTYKKDETFETTPDRAAALGDVVTTVE